MQVDCLLLVCKWIACCWFLFSVRRGLLRWRSELADLIAEAKLPLAMQARNCREPDKINSSALGGMRASTIKVRVREWRKLRAYSLGVAGIAWPPNLGIVLEYIQERVAEPCARTVPHSVLAAFSFMEKAGGVAVRDRVSGEQVLRNFVDQSTMDLEGGAPPKRNSPLLPLKLLGALELLVVDSSHRQFLQKQLC